LQGLIGWQKFGFWWMLYSGATLERSRGEQLESYWNLDSLAPIQQQYQLYYSGLRWLGSNFRLNLEGASVNSTYGSYFTGRIEAGLDLPSFTKTPIELEFKLYGATLGGSEYLLQLLYRTPRTAIFRAWLALGYTTASLQTGLAQTLVFKVDASSRILLQPLSTTGFSSDPNLSAALLAQEYQELWLETSKMQYAYKGWRLASGANLQWHPRASLNITGSGAMLKQIKGDFWVGWLEYMDFVYRDEFTNEWYGVEGIYTSKLTPYNALFKRWRFALGLTQRFHFKYGDWNIYTHLQRERTPYPEHHPLYMQRSINTLGLGSSFQFQL
jgi:hypothetical protein